MSKTDTRPTTANESIHEQYILGVRIVELSPADGDEPRYRFEAPQHQGMEFAEAETAELYADIYFFTNGFAEEGTGDRGVPPEIIGSGRAVLAAYFLTLPNTDVDWVASFFGLKPHRVREYVSWVQERAEEIRTGAEAEGVA